MELTNKQRRFHDTVNWHLLQWGKDFKVYGDFNFDDEYNPQCAVRLVDNNGNDWDILITVVNKAVRIVDRNLDYSLFSLYKLLFKMATR